MLLAKGVFLGQKHNRKSGTKNYRDGNFSLLNSKAVCVGELTCVFVYFLWVNK